MKADYEVLSMLGSRALERDGMYIGQGSPKKRTNRTYRDM